MTYKRVLNIYKDFKKFGKIPRFIDYYSSFKNETRYMYAVKLDFINKQDDDFRIPFGGLYQWCAKNNYVFGSSFCISIPLFLITLNQSFIKKFCNFLNDIVYKELIKYRQKTSIGGIACLHQLYTPSEEPIKYMLLVDKEENFLHIRVYSTLMLTYSGNERYFDLLEEKIRDFIYTKAIFLEENDEKEIKIDFYKKLKYKWKTDYLLTIQYFNKFGYFPPRWWSTMRVFFRMYMEDVYKIDNLKIFEYMHVLSNNKFFTKWGIIMNPRMHLLACFEDETLEEVFEIYMRLGAYSRFLANGAFYNSVGYRTVSDIILDPRNHRYCEKRKFDPCYHHFGYHDSHVLLSDWNLERTADSEVCDYFDLVRYNNYGDITGTIYPDYNKERSISFLSSLRSVNMVDARPLNYCVRPYSDKIKMLESDVYDDLQMRIPMYEASIKKERAEWAARTGNIDLGAELEKLKKLKK